MNGKPVAFLGSISLVISLAAMVVPATGSAQGVYVYPKAGQSQQQQQTDSGECHGWAVGQSGYDPTRPVAAAPQYCSPPPSSNVNSGVFGRGSYGQGGGIADAGKGAAGGALIGAIAGDAGKGAAIGALSGLFIGGVKRSNADAERQAWERQQADQQRQAQQYAAQQNAYGQSEYQRAFATCMRGRDYSVD